jgi:glycosyltransferase involved in cell wall biosynthesis
MKLLVLAQTPPPLHGQSLAVRDLLAVLRATPGWEIHHVELRLSHDNADVGRWRPGKIFTTLGAGLRAAGTCLRHGRMPLYYVPAPGKRGALYRDWLCLLLCRPFTRGLVLHWHAVGLGAWLKNSATAPERWISALLLGRAALAIIQAEAGRDDADALGARRCVVVPNGVPATATGPRRQFTPGVLEVLFVGLGSAEKGLFDALEGVRLAAAGGLPCRLTAIGPFADAATRAEFATRAAAAPDLARHLGFVSAEERDRRLAAADVFCFPSYYPHEGQPAVVLEALAHDLPIIATRWRGIPENLPDRHVHLVPVRSPAAIAAALRAVRDEGPPGGALLEHHRRHFTQELHHARLLAALASVAATA